MAIRLKKQNITNMYTPIELVTTALQHLHVGGGVTDHGYLHGLGDNDHPQYLLSSASTRFITGSVNTNDFLGTAATQSFIHTSDSTNYIAASNSIIFALTDHTHTVSDFGYALSDHSHGSVMITSIIGDQLTAASASSGLTIGVPNYITTAFGAAIQGNDTYTQNTGTIQFVNSNGVSFGLSDNGVMTASIPAVGGAQTGISAIIDWDNNQITEGSVYLDNAIIGNVSLSYGLVDGNSGTIVGSVSSLLFSNSNNVEFGVSDGVVTALANFSQSVQTDTPAQIVWDGNTFGDTNIPFSSGTLTLVAGNNISFNQDIANYVALVGPNAFTVTVIGSNTLGTMASIVDMVSLAGGDNITLSQDGQAITIIGPSPTDVTAGIHGLVASNASYTSGSVIMSAQNNITIGTFATSDSQYVRFSVGNYLTTAALSNHLHGSNVLTMSTAGSNIQFSSASNGLTMAIPAYITTYSSGPGGGAGTGFTSISTSGTDIAGTLSTNGLNLAMPKYITTAAVSTHSHGTPSLNLSLLTGSISSASNGLSLSITGPTVSQYVNTSQIGTLYFSNVPGFSWSSSVNGVSTSVYIVT